VKHIMAFGRKYNLWCYDTNYICSNLHVSKLWMSQNTSANNHWFMV